LIDYENCGHESEKHGDHGENDEEGDTDSILEAEGEDESMQELGNHSSSLEDVHSNLLDTAVIETLGKREGVGMNLIEVH
jgi:hypothetical protein